MCGEVIMECILPFVVADLIDKGINGNSMPDIWKYGGILFVCAMISLFFGVTAGITAAKASTGFAKNLRKDMYYKIQKFSFKNIDKFKTCDSGSKRHDTKMLIKQLLEYNPLVENLIFP